MPLPETFCRVFEEGPEAVLASAWDRLAEQPEQGRTREQLMAALRMARRQTALVVAVCDITGHWDLDRVTAALSDFADLALQTSVDFLLRHAASRGQIELTDTERPSRECGYVVLAMGKHGARELNYSSDIDLIVLFDLDKAAYRGTRSAQEFFVRLTRDLVTMLDERTKDGYVCRTDLRLRPDPGAMPLAISYTAALTYYESMGQNWERAAMIKARPAAGDLTMGQDFLKELRPFVWRKNLDFWAIQDVHSIKRQIHSHKGGGAIALAGHNLKLGRGGIREIEFFVQTQQLIYGGRSPGLRTPRTRAGLRDLAAAGRIDQATADQLDEAYVYLRGVEHRLQMIEDQQTHSLPNDQTGLAAIAAFLGCSDVEALREALFRRLCAVETAYSALFEEAPTLSGPGNLVFTGGDPGSETLKTLQALGFEDGTKVFNLVRTWHHGRYRATRSTRSRELLTELVPTLLTAFGKTPSPEHAITKFDEFLAGLPAGVQLFSLIHANPWLLDLLAEILGTAPALAERLSRKPDLLEAVLSPAFFAPVPALDKLSADLAEALNQARDFEDVLDLSRRWVNDYRFQAGVQILQHLVDIAESCRTLSDVAQAALMQIFPKVAEGVAQAHGVVEGGQTAILALGKLGSREMTVTSDLDLIAIYDIADSNQTSDGPKPLAASQYYSRLAQRFINALTAPTAEGQLYEIDMRLRPSGKAGPIATSLKAFSQYHGDSSWTWEHMALTRARVALGDAELSAKIESEIRNILTRPRDADRLLVDVADMRERIAKEHQALSLWQVKHLRGGLIDLEFITQYLQLRHAADHPDILHPSTNEALVRLGKHGILGATLVDRLIRAQRLYLQIQMFLRLSTRVRFEEDTASEGLKASLARATDMPDFATLKDSLIAHAQGVQEIFVEMIEAPASEAMARIEPSD